MLIGVPAETTAANPEGCHTETAKKHWLVGTHGAVHPAPEWPQRHRCRLSSCGGKLSTRIGA